jgi:type II pantothenate kinase
MQAAIDFGISNTDVLVRTADGELHHWMQPHDGRPQAATIKGLLQAGNFEVSDMTQLAVTGGQHRLLPEQIDQCRLQRINEVESIGRGGLALASGDEPILVVSGGSGVAMVAAQGERFTHVTGTGVGGGTLLGLARILLDTVDPVEINVLAAQGNANAVDLALSDVVSGPIGDLPADATAVNFGRIARQAPSARKRDMAAALVTLVSQVIGTIAINAARSQQIERIVVTGHLTDMSTIRDGLARVSAFFGLPIETPSDAGRATALGALLSLKD